MYGHIYFDNIRICHMYGHIACFVMSKLFIMAQLLHVAQI